MEDYEFDTLETGRSLKNNQRLIAALDAATHFELIFEDGVLILMKMVIVGYEKDGSVELWSSAESTDIEGPYELKMQKDGNLVIYGKENKVIWSLKHNDFDTKELVLDNKGDLYLTYKSGKPPKYIYRSQEE